jgi:hypothetical protein
MPPSPRFLKDNAVITYCYVSRTHFNSRDMTGNKIIANNLKIIAELFKIVIITKPKNSDVLHGVVMDDDTVQSGTCLPTFLRNIMFPRLV